ncbi:MAG: sigma-70 family RNA polymerase sigma factor [Actinomycetota bacterium]
MPTFTTDADLVAGHLAGDPSALAGIYDRYADTLHDTAAAMLNDRTEAADTLQDTILIAAERLGQLRDPSRLKPWLFAILRNEVYRRSRRRRRTVATDFSGGEDGFDMADERQIDAADAVSEAMAGDEFASLLRGAARGLDERDQLVLELSVRQGLEGQDLADALGVSANQSYTLVHRMRERVERSLGAYAIAKAGRKDCDELDSILARWDGEFTVLIRKRVARHIDRCDTCSTNRTKVAPIALFAGAPALAAPPELRDRILTKAGGVVPKHDYGFTATDGFPEVLRAGRRIAAWVAPTAAAAVILLAGAFAGLVWLGGDDASGELLQSAPVTTVGSTSTTTSTPPAVTTTDPVVAPVAASTSTVPETTVPVTTVPDTTVPVTTPPVTTTPVTTVAGTVAPPAAPVTTATPTTRPPGAAPATTTATTTSTTTTTTTTAAPRPGELVLSASTIDLGTSASSGSSRLTNVGDLPVSWQVTGDPGPFGVSPVGGTLAGGESVDVVATLMRGQVGEGTQSATMQVSGDGTTRPLALRATIERAPSFGTPDIQGVCITFSSSQQVVVGGNVTVTDETPPLSVTLSVSSSARSGSTAMSLVGGRYEGALQWTFGAAESVPSTWSWTITATDGRGNSDSRSGSITVTC